MEPHTQKYQSYIREGLEAFGQDPSYAISIAQQASTLVVQRAERATRILLPVVELSSSDV